MIITLSQGKVEASVLEDGLAFEKDKDQSYQFTRRGYFCIDQVS